MYKYLVSALLLFVPGVTWAVPATVGYIFDGDTFSAKVYVDKNTQISVRVRLRNVDTPEIHGACDAEIKKANRAKERLEQLIPVGSTVELDQIKDDKYLGRIDARVKMADGRDVASILIKENLGRPYNGGRRAGWCD